MSPEPKAPPTAPPVNLLKFAVDIGPVVVFILTYVLSKNPFTATELFMVAMVVAIIVAKFMLKEIPPLLIISGLMVIVFGAMTIFLHDRVYIQIKPTIYYALLSVLLFYGGYSGQPLLKQALGDVYPELSDTGWQILGRNFAWLFLILAIMNEAIRHAYGFETWAWTKLWLFIPITMLFGAANIPLILKHTHPAAANDRA